MPSPPILLLPGTLCTAEVFSRQIEALHAVCADIRVIEFRLESSIAEMASTVAGHIRDGEKVAVAGFSMGGMVALDLAARFPLMIDRIALLNSNWHSDEPDRRSRRLQYVTEAGRSSPRSVLEDGFLGNYLYHQRTADRQLILDMAETHGLLSFAAQSEALASRPDCSDALRGLDCPLLVLGSRHDVLCPPRVQSEMHQMARDAQLVMLEDSGHFSLLEQAQEVSAALVDWYLGRPPYSR
jgi:pimeloyl-ACP methyl ester carboxylesterase